MENPLKYSYRVYTVLRLTQKIENVTLKDKHLYVTIGEDEFYIGMDFTSNGSWVMLIRVNGEFTTILRNETIEKILSNDFYSSFTELKEKAIENRKEKDYFYWVIDNEDYQPERPNCLDIYDQYWRIVDINEAIGNNASYTESEYDLFLDNGVPDIFKPIKIAFADESEKQEAINEGGLYEGEEL